MSSYIPHIGRDGFPELRPMTAVRWYGLGDDKAKISMAEGLFNGELMQLHQKFRRAQQLGITEFTRVRLTSPHLHAEYRYNNGQEFLHVRLTAAGQKRLEEAQPGQPKCVVLYFDTPSGQPFGQNAIQDTAMALRDALADIDPSLLSNDLEALSPVYYKDNFMLAVDFGLLEQRGVFLPDIDFHVQARWGTADATFRNENSAPVGGSVMYNLTRYTQGYWWRYPDYPSYDYYTDPVYTLVSPPRLDVLYMPHNYFNDDAPPDLVAVITAPGASSAYWYGYGGDAEKFTTVTQAAALMAVLEDPLIEEMNPVLVEDPAFILGPPPFYVPIQTYRVRDAYNRLVEANDVRMEPHFFARYRYIDTQANPPLPVFVGVMEAYGKFHERMLAVEEQGLEQQELMDAIKALPWESLTEADWTLPDYYVFSDTQPYFINGSSSWLENGIARQDKYKVNPERLRLHLQLLRTGGVTTLSSQITTDTTFPPEGYTAFAF